MRLVARTVLAVANRAFLREHFCPARGRLGIGLLAGQLKHIVRHVFDLLRGQKTVAAKGGHQVLACVRMGRADADFQCLPDITELTAPQPDIVDKAWIPLRARTAGAVAGCAIVAKGRDSGSDLRELE